MNATLATSLSLPLAEAPRLAAKVRSAADLRTALRTSGTRLATQDFALLDRVLRLDAPDHRVEVQAGVRWNTLGAYLAEHAVAAAAGLEHQAERCAMAGTVGECIARNDACPDGTPMAAHVIALAVVTADGELRRASRSQQAELFQRVIGGHGLIAAAYSATLDIESLVRAFAAPVEPVALGAMCKAATASAPMRLMVPPANLQPFLVDLRQAFDDFRLPVCELSVRKVLPDRESWLRWATEELALVEVRLPARTTLPAQVAATQVRGALIAAALAHGGRFDLATGFDASRAQVEAAYPMFKSFLAEKRRADARGRLGGAFYAHYRALFQRESCDVRWA